MNKAQLTEELAKRFENNKRAAAHALESVLDTITRQVASGEKVGITGFGTFERIDRPARMVRNPRTGERKRAKKTSVAKFRPGAELKAVVAGEKKLPKLVAAKTAAAPARKSATKSASAKTTPSKTTTAKKASSRGTTKASTTKATTTRATPATTSTTKSTAAKKTTAKAPATTAAAKKASTPKAAAKKSATKKSTARKA